jgi:hypothetical protein
MLLMPQLSAPVIFWYDPALAPVARQGSTGVVSILDRVSGYSLAQLTATNQPVFNINGIQAGPQGIVGSTYKNENYDLMFTAASTQYLTNSNIGAALSKQDFTICWVSNVAAIAGSTGYAFSLGNSSTGSYVAVGFGGGNSTVAVKNDAAATASATHANDGNAHAYTLVKSGTTFTLRQDAVQVISLSGSGTYSFDTFTLGALNTGGAVSAPFGGNVLQIAGWQSAVAAPEPVEVYLMAQCGVSQLID